MLDAKIFKDENGNEVIYVPMEENKGLGQKFKEWREDHQTAWKVIKWSAIALATGGVGVGIWFLSGNKDDDALEEKTTDI